jgi:hypothetical protein
MDQGPGGFLLIKNSRIKISCKCPFKGSVKRKLRWVENSINRCVWAWDCGAGRFFYVVLLRRHLSYTIFQFPVNTAQFIGEFWKNTSNVTLHLLKRSICRIVSSAKLLRVRKGEAGRLRRASRQSTANSKRQLEVFVDFFFRCTSPFSGELIAGPIVLAQHKGDERIGEARTTVRSASPIIIEFAY